MSEIKPTTKLPKIVALLGCTDHGPCDPVATASCPHCGADGRYVYHFLCEDGNTRGAMAGCLKLFPRHPLVGKVEAVFTKARRYDQEGWNLPSWDQDILNACDSLRDGKIDFGRWEQVVQIAFRQRNTYLDKKHGGRRFR